MAGMVTKLVGGQDGPGLRRVDERPAGNPLYVREIADALVRDGVVRLDGDTADVPARSFDRAPGSLVSAVTGRLHYLTEATPGGAALGIDVVGAAGRGHHRGRAARRGGAVGLSVIRQALYEEHPAGTAGLH